MICAEILVVWPVVMSEGYAFPCSKQIWCFEVR